VDERFLKEEGPEVFSGNELLLKGALEAGCSLLTGYPGSPISEFFDAAFAQRELLQQRGVHADLANNEALAAARLNGARLVGARAMAVMKSVGLHVAADGLALGNLMEPSNAGGCVVVVGDDAAMESTQINNDSRYLSQHLHMPVMEPATFQEIKDWLDVAFTLSSVSNLYLTYRITTPQADGGGTVWTHPNRKPAVRTMAPQTLDTDRFNIDQTVLLPPRTQAREASLPARFEVLLKEACAQSLNRLIPGTDRQWGFIAAGFAYTALEHALRNKGLSGRYPILKLGLTYPIDASAVQELSRQVDGVVVVEEKRGFIESQVIAILRDKPVWGKRFPNDLPGFPAEGGFNVSRVAERLTALLSPADPLPVYHALPVLPARTPTFCPGCPHRDSSSVFLEIQRDFKDAAYMKHTHRADVTDLVFHGETGCFTMLMFEPNQSLMHNYSGMGLGGGTGAGADPFIRNKQVVFLGDSTFFHSGLIAVSDSLKAGQDVTYVILDNKTTAMTGHQPTPGIDINLMGERTFAQNIEAIVRAMAGQHVPVWRMDPGERDTYRARLEQTILQPGVKIVIADKECGLVVERDRRRARQADIRRDGFLAEERFIQINADACESCLECTRLTGCPGLTMTDTPFGVKMATDPHLCVADGACVKIQACPAFEEVIVNRRQPAATLSSVPPVSPVSPSGVAAADPFYIHIAGVGGQGAGLLTAVLVRAAQDAGWRVLFTDKKGLAVRNGSVQSQIVMTRDGGAWAPQIPQGRADLVLGLDALETARSVQTLRVADASRTAFVLHEGTQPTVRMLLGKDRPVSVMDGLRGSARPDAFWFGDVGARATQEWGSRLGLNFILLGVAAQKGWLPLSPDHLEAAMDACVARADREHNRRAFRLGRLAADEKAASTVPATSLLAVRPAPSRAYEQVVQSAAPELDLPESLETDFQRRVEELLAYGGLPPARRYAQIVALVFRRDRRLWNWEATRTVIEQAFRVIAIKDEFYVADLLSRPAKRKADEARYRIDASRGDRLTVRHFNQPEFPIGSRRFRFKLVTRDWQLRGIRRLRFLRDLWPGWHREEKAFRDTYLAQVEQFLAPDEAAYQRWLTLLRGPEQVRGYRALRRPAMARVMRQAEEALQKKVDFPTCPRV